MDIPAIPPTPWETQPVAWRVDDNHWRQNMINDQVVSGYEYLVREVRVQAPINQNYKKLTVNSAEDIVTHTEKEFDLLRKLGLEIPETDWFIFEDEIGKIRTLARVAIIDGMALKKSNDSNREDISRVSQFISSYYQSGRAGERLAEIAPSQCVLGIARPSGHSAEELTYLVDIEPVY